MKGRWKDSCCRPSFCLPHSLTTAVRTTYTTVSSNTASSRHVTILTYPHVYTFTHRSYTCIHVGIVLKGIILDYVFEENDYSSCLGTPLPFLPWLRLTSAKSTVFSRGSEVMKTPPQVYCLGFQEPRQITENHLSISQ